MTVEVTGGRYLRDERLASSMSLRDAAERLQVTAVQLGEYERGRSAAPTEFIRRFAAAFPAFDQARYFRLVAETRGVRITSRGGGDDDEPDAMPRRKTGTEI